MKTRYSAYFLAAAIALMPFSAATATESSTGPDRYFLQNTKTFWKNAFQARQVFEDGFTANLSDFQLTLAKLAGMKPVQVKRFSILQEEATTPEPSPTPVSPQGWGVVTVLPNGSTDNGEGMTIAVLDTGIDREHPDLSERIGGCVDYAGTESKTEDFCADENGHGTHVAGILAADGGPDDEGMTGIVPAATVLAYKVCNAEGLCFSDDIAVAMRDAVDAGAQIIVLGFGGEEASSFIDASIGYAQEHEVLVVAAAGNDGPYEEEVDWPARDPRVVSVGAVDEDAVPTEFSSRGTNATTEPFVQDEGDVEFAAPGVNVESTFIDGSYSILSGTSMAAPHVAGLAALLWQADDEHPAEATRLVLRELARDIAPPGDDPATGWGMPVLR
ncbi:MAG TPA: S8 family peptidase [Candidatus Paceibacterota bacterium]|nr:S8 family peptidase [Candidatus Paceibacterota bacterium]